MYYLSVRIFFQNEKFPSRKIILHFNSVYNIISDLSGFVYLQTLIPYVLLTLLLPRVLSKSNYYPVSWCIQLLRISVFVAIHVLCKKVFVPNVETFLAFS